MRISLTLVLYLLMPLSLSAGALEEYVESGRHVSISGGTLANEWCSLPEPVFEELTRPRSFDFTLRYLSEVAASEHPLQQGAAARLIVQAFYLYIKGDSARYAKQNKEGFISFGVPRVFLNAIRDDARISRET